VLFESVTFSVKSIQLLYTLNTLYQIKMNELKLKKYFIETVGKL